MDIQCSPSQIRACQILIVTKLNVTRIWPCHELKVAEGWNWSLRHCIRKACFEGWNYSLRHCIRTQNGCIRKACFEGWNWSLRHCIRKGPCVYPKRAVRVSEVYPKSNVHATKQVKVRVLKGRPCVYPKRPCVYPKRALLDPKKPTLGTTMHTTRGHPNGQ